MLQPKPDPPTLLYLRFATLEGFWPKRIGLGSPFHDGYSLLVWRPFDPSSTVRFARSLKHKERPHCRRTDGLGLVPTSLAVRRRILENAASEDGSK
jgi:hypothetical protein